MKTIPIPQDAWDTYFHVFRHGTATPTTSTAAYSPMDAPVWKLNAMHSSIGIARGVVVQSTAEGLGYNLIMQLLEENPRLRGVIRYSEDLSDADLDALHNAGVRGIRFAFARFMKQQRVTKTAFLNTVERVRALGWHVKVHVEGPDLLEIEGWLRATNGTLVVDHMAHLRPEEGLEQPALALLLDLQQGGNVWVGISNFDRWSNEGAPKYSDSLPLARTLMSNAPDRVIWGTDWPHPMYRNPYLQNEPPPDDQDLLRFALECADWEANLIKKLLVTNPAVLYD